MTKSTRRTPVASTQEPESLLPGPELGSARVDRAVGWALAAAAGLCLAACQQAGDEPSGEKSSAQTGSEEKNCCHGKNACKGKGGCAVPGKNGCAGKNECKGQGGCNMHCPK